MGIYNGAFVSFRSVSLFVIRATILITLVGVWTLTAVLALELLYLRFDLADHLVRSVVKLFTFWRVELQHLREFCTLLVITQLPRQLQAGKSRTEPLLPRLCEARERKTVLV